MSISCEYVSLGSLVEPGEFIDGPFGSNLKASEYIDSGIPVLRLQNIRVNRFDEKNIRFISEDKANSLARHTYRPGDVVITKLGDPCGVACQVPEGVSSGIVVADVLRFRSSSINHRYLVHYLNSSGARHQIDRLSKGTTRQRVNLSDFKKVTVPLPPIAEQRRIAAILDKADAVRRKRKEAIALTEELLRSAFLDMFGDPVINPKGWETVTLKSQTSDLRYGTSAKCTDSRNSNLSLPVLRIPNIIGEQISWHSLKFTELTEKEIEKLTLSIGDLLFVRSNGNPEHIGRCAVYQKDDQESLYASYLIRARLKPDSCLLPEFIRDIVSFPTYRFRLIREARTTAGNYNINTKGLGGLQLISPPREEQDSYLRLVSHLRSRLESLADCLATTENLFNSLLQRAFRGDL